MLVSAGCLVRLRDPELGDLYLVVHPSGAYNRRSPWSIPKGEFPRGADPEAEALRELREETGLEARILRPLGECVYRSRRKRVVGFLAELTSDPGGLWRTEHGYAVPPEKLQWEVDAAEFLPAKEAESRLKEEQRVFLQRIRNHEDGGPEGAGTDPDPPEGG